MKKYKYVRGSAKYPQSVEKALIELGATQDGLSRICATSENNLYVVQDNGDVNFVNRKYNQVLYDMLVECGEEVKIIPFVQFKFNVGDKVQEKSFKYPYTISEQVGTGGFPAYRVEEDPNLVLTESVLEEQDGINVLTWDDIAKNSDYVTAWSFSSAGYPKYGIYRSADTRWRGMAATEHIAIMQMAAGKISFLIDMPVYGGWVPYGEDAYYIDSTLTVNGTTRYDGGLLRFSTRNQAELFLKYNEDTVKDYLML